MARRCACGVHKIIFVATCGTDASRRGMRNFHKAASAAHNELRHETGMVCDFEIVVYGICHVTYLHIYVNKNIRGKRFMSSLKASDTTYCDSTLSTCSQVRK